MDKNLETKTLQVLHRLGIKEVNSGVTTGMEWLEAHGKEATAFSPIDGNEIAKVKTASLDDYELVMKKAGEAFRVWRKIPAPQRGEVVRQI